MLLLHQTTCTISIIYAITDPNSFIIFFLQQALIMFQNFQIIQSRLHPNCRYDR